jgi:6-pyruvoyltetrahydropterin/6-carboxytetrahydropterin synthase
MYLTISKKFEISCSHRLYNKNWNDKKNYDIFGDESKGEHGHGHNFDVTFIFNGPVDKDTGMVINVSVIKDRINLLLKDRFDHKYLNLDTPPFDNIIPTPENIARQLFLDAGKLFDNYPVDLVACHLGEEPDIDVVTFVNGNTNRQFQAGFSSARRTFSPHLSDRENDQMFGKASRKSGHGHHYKVIWTLTGNAENDTGLIYSEVKMKKLLDKIYDKYDHTNLNNDIPELKDNPITTEILCRQLFDELAENIPVEKVRLNENDYFFIEYDKNQQFRMGVKSSFHAAHRLYSESLNENEIEQIYNNCANPNGHGHKYKVEMVLDGILDERNGVIYNLSDVTYRLKEILGEWNYKHLDLETDDFKNTISTGENIVSVLWNKLNYEFNKKLARLSLWETPNNRFSIRRSINK